MASKMASIMKRAEVLEVTGLCYTSIYNKEKRGEFPARRKLGARSVGWVRHEVEAWIDGLQCVVSPAIPVDPLAIPVDPLSTMVIK